ncbi:chymotrypsin-like elastase family member 1 [Planococcus citri]|uniref:chymotrypsin-like elastase family member 1 n=1 Tax=Planococcus citri TaxID=170843 RepID=UPI0031F88C47
MIVLLRIFLCVLAVTTVSSSYEEWTGKAVNKCKEYVKYACDDQNSIINSTLTPNTLDKVMNGEDVPFGLLPHMAFILLSKKLNETTFSGKCSGSLISENFVLSAAHCTENIFPINNTFGTVKLGSVTSQNDGTGQWFNVIEIYVHPNFTVLSKNWNDILLLKLDPKVQFSSQIKPICLGTELNNDLNTVYLAGWGLDENGTSSKDLKGAELSIKDDEIVKSACNHAAKKNFINSTTVICAGFANKTKCSNKGDSGGPLQAVLSSGCPNTYELIGVTISHAPSGQVCPRCVSFFTNVKAYIPWIEGIVWPDYEFSD